MIRHTGLPKRGLRLFCPDVYCSTDVTAISPAELREAGIRAALLDLDNTLVGWQRSDLSDRVLGWLDALRAADIRLYLVSNTRFGRRLQRLSEELGMPFVRRAWKPRRRGFRAAMEAMEVGPAETAMIGDQMFTDVLGGNRLGLLTIMVRPMARREFLGTKISRAAEAVLLAWFRRRGWI
ncbi:MAG: YqeG family HAD IIIA-type phosphatase [Chthonomonadales bacterium]|nr:YqeG family HAD IIIA-type phosphatase [Chthonomonadales bacterium]